ncbi:MAG: low molecular weight phosphatase family protein [Thermoplasmata archaeon]|nr:low molecular weight phosphatase family protein [Thermoplasmata archaeon]MCI4359694.1 low molecular weight phosphatase family protein [Thermoplasmata archaeon]
MTERIALFICIENAGRSLMAEAIFNSDPPTGWRATSAGTRPAQAPNPRTGPMLKELGLALPDHSPRLLTTEMMDQAGVRITMGCMDDTACPAHLRTLELRDWALEDPAKLDDAGFRRVRDQLVQRIRGLRTELALGNRRSADVTRDRGR